MRHELHGFVMFFSEMQKLYFSADWTDPGGREMAQVKSLSG